MSVIKYGILRISRVTLCVPIRSYSWNLNLHSWDCNTHNWLKLCTATNTCHKFSSSQEIVQSKYDFLHLQCRAFSRSICKFKSKDNSGHDIEEEGGDDVIDDKEIEELFQQHIPSGIGEGDHRIFIVHPDVKWGKKKQYLTTAELMMAEAVGLVNTLQDWRVVDKLILSTKTPESKRIFGKGNFESLTERIRRTPGVTAVFVNVERLSPVSERDLEEAWGLKVFDRYSVVLHIFRCNARTKEAKLQISLAEIPLLRYSNSQITSET